MRFRRANTEYSTACDEVAMEAHERKFAITISAAHGMNHFLRRLLPPLIPIWTVAFGVPLWQLGLLFGAQTLGTAMGQAPLGVLSDRYDRRYILTTGVVLVGVMIVSLATVPGLDIFAIDVAIGGSVVSGQLLVMVAVMFVWGIGAAVLHPTGYPLMTANIDAERKGKVLGMWGSAAKLGDGLAPAMVGILLLALAWNAVLLAFGVLALGYAVVLFIVLGGFETRPGRTATEGGDETDADDSDESLDVWHADKRLYVYPMLMVFLFFAIRMPVAGGVSVFIPEFINTEYGYSFSLLGFAVTPESTASFYYSALLIAAGVVQLGTGELVDRYDPRKVLIGFLVVATVVLVAIAFASLSPLVLFVVLLLLGGSLWGISPARDALVSDITPADREGRTFGYLWTGILLVGSTSPVIVGYIGDVAGLRAGFWLLAVVTLLSAIPIVLLMSNRIYVGIDDLGTPHQAD